MDNATLLQALVSRSRAARARTVTLATTFCALAALLAPTAGAALREYRVSFEPSESAGVAGYAMVVGVSSGDYVMTFDLGAPPAQGGTIDYSLELEDSVDLYVALTAYDAEGVSSLLSNELRVAAVPSPPPSTGGDDGSTGGDDGSTGGDDGSTGGDDGSTGGDDGSTGGDDGSTGGDDGSMGGSDDTPVPPTPMDDEIGVGLAALPGGMLSRLLNTASFDFLAMDSLANAGDFRPARCDLDGDGDLDLVAGFGKESGAQLAIVLIENGAVVAQDSIRSGNPTYQRAVGETSPACGDLDGDGLAEIVVGFERGMRGVVQVFDDIETGFAPLASGRTDEAGYMQIPVPKGYYGAVFPAIGDIDGDGRDELVAGLDRTKAGLVVILDDAATDFALHAGNQTGKPWITVNPMTDSKGGRDRAMPALGDFDGDGRDEMAVSFPRGSRGFVAILDDAIVGYPTSPEDAYVVETGRADYRRADGATRAAFGDVDDDGIDELVIGFQRSGAHEVQIFDDLVASMNPMGTEDGFVTGPEANARVYPGPLP